MHSDAFPPDLHVGTPPPSVGAQAFLTARNFLLQHRADYATAYRDFRCPRLARFNWALDVFDPMAAGNESPPLWIVDEQGWDQQVSFSRMARRSN
jgi:acetyl-CoA synthetase